MGLARMERAKAHDRSELESRANSISTETCHEHAACIGDFDGRGPGIYISRLIDGCFSRDDRPPVRTFEVEREVFEASA